MPFASLRARLVPTLAFTVAGLAAISLVGCKQSNGERCEIDSDCASGICGPEGTASTTTSAQGLRCVAMIGEDTSGDASQPEPTVDAPVDLAPDAPAGLSPEAGSGAGDGAAPDGAADALPSGG